MKTSLQIILLLLFCNIAAAEKINNNTSPASSSSLTISVSNIRYNSFRASWTAHPDATSYKLFVQYKASLDEVYESFSAYNGIVLSMTTLYYDVTDIFYSFSTKHKVIVQAIRNDAVIDEAELVFSVLGKPVPFGLSNVDNNTVRMTWNLYKYYSYTIYVYKLVGETLQPVTGYPLEHSQIYNMEGYQYDISGLEEGTPYVFALSSYVYSSGVTSDTIHHTHYTLPKAPQATAATLTGPNTFQANWSISPVPPQIKLYVKESVSGKWILRGQVIEQMSAFKVNNLIPGTTYEYQVSSVNPNGESDLSNIIRVTTINLPVPVAIAPSVIYSWGFDARWNTLVNAIGYQLQVSDGGDWVDYEISSGTTSHYYVEGLKPNINYQYRVKAYYSNGYTDYSNVIQVKTLDAPIARSVIRDLSDPSIVTAVWDNYDGATGYKLYVVSNESSAYNPAGYFPKTLTATEARTISGLLPGHSYRFYVQATIPAGITAESNRIDFFTRPATPVALNADHITSTSFDAEWDDINDDADKTYLSVYNAATSLTVPGYSAREVSLESETVTGLTFSTTYYYTVEVEKNGLRSNTSNIVYVKTDYRELTLTCNPAAAGTCTGGGWVKDYSTVTVSASAKPGYEFINWTENGTEVSESVDYTFTITKNRSLVANFVAISQYVVGISVNPQTGGRATGDGAYSTGSSVTVSATNNPGYTFINWTEGGKQVSSSASFTFTISDNRNLTANFAQNPAAVYILSLLTTQGGTASGTGAYAPDARVTAVATASEGYEFVNWTENGKEVSRLASYSFNITASRTFIANFQPASAGYTLTLSANPSSAGKVSGDGYYETGASVSAIATPAMGYRFVNWTEGANEVSTTATYTFTINSDRSLAANFTLLTDIDDVEKDSICIYPNPATQYFYITGADNGAVYSIVSAAGKKIITGKITSHSHLINVTHLATGLYLVTIEKGNRLISLKLLKK